MKPSAALLASIQAQPAGMTLAQLLGLHPQVAKRSAQRWVGQYVLQGAISYVGEGPARRYFPPVEPAENAPQVAASTPSQAHSFPSYIPVSADSQDILAYINQPLAARKPVGYQHEFLEAYQPNVTWYLPQSLRRQLHAMGNTAHTMQPAGTYSRAILNRLLIDLSWASSHLEGNTYSKLDTVELIEHGKAAQGKAALETQMILNHKSAIELLVENIDTVGFNHYTLMNLHSALSENLLANPSDEGRVRQHTVDISQSVYRPLAIPQQIDATLTLLLAKLSDIGDPFEQSFFAMVHLPYLQPFADINKRTSRLAANLPLFRANLCPLTFLDVPEPAYSRAVLGVYEMTRVELLRDLYVWAYERSTQEYIAIRQNVVQPDPIRLAYRDAIKQAVRSVVQQPQLDTLTTVDQALQEVHHTDRATVRAAVLQALQKLHVGVLARYGLRPAELAAWHQHKNKN
jgi:hypothetical protein